MGTGVTRPVNWSTASGSSVWSTAFRRNGRADSGGLADFDFDQTPELADFILGSTLP